MLIYELDANNHEISKLNLHIENNDLNCSGYLVNNEQYCSGIKEKIFNPTNFLIKKNKLLNKII